jgi:nuclear transport factor 2 (NTF2) superfamily protein
MAEAYTEAWNSQIPENVAAFYTEDAALIVNGDSSNVGRWKVTNFAKSFMRNFPDMKLTMDSLVAEQTTYRYHWSFVGTYGGPYGNGNKVVFSGFERWTLSESGLIANSIGTYDEEDFRRQLNAKNDGQSDL